MAASIGCAFHDTQVDRDTVVARRRTHGFKITVFDAYTLANVVGEEFLLQVGLEIGTSGALNPKGIARYKRFTERYEIAFFRCGIGNLGDDLIEGRIALQPQRSDLRQADRD